MGVTLADPELPNRGGQICAEIFESFFRRSRKKLCIFPKKFHLSPNISDDLF